MKSVFFRYFVHTASLMFLSFCILGVALVWATSSVVNDNYRARDYNASQETAALLETRAGGGTHLSDDIRQAISTIAAVSQCHIAICDTGGRVLFSTGSQPGLTAGDTLSASALAAALDGGRLFLDPKTDQPSFRYETYARVTTGADGHAARVILLTGDRMPARTLTGAFLRIYLLTAALVLLIAFGTAYVNSRALARPLYDMAACARQFERGDFSARPTRWITRDDEIGELAAAFNSMAGALEKGEELRRGFIGSVSHELKSPMTSISGYIGGLLDGTIPADRREETLRIVSDEIMRLSRLVSGMLELSRHQSGQMDLSPRPMDIAELSARLLIGFEGKINAKRLNVEVLVPDEPLVILADPDSMTQVMTNLLDNAVKFCDPGGAVSLSITRRSGRAYVVLRNSGATIPPEDLPYIFDQFHKGDRSRSMDRTGLGLGLYLVKSILNAHNEDIFVMSGSGLTEFMFSLPVTARQKAENEG
ncbi:MAG: HAMP domain-containing histidine kinase [Oscillospiraceae bacterium]|nr:HAMP domain-containing histidine kinase [Oscillospiraceae bacterium]